MLIYQEKIKKNDKCNENDSNLKWQQITMETHFIYFTVGDAVQYNTF